MSDMKTNLQYIKLVEHWQKTTDPLARERIEETILKSVDPLLIQTCNKLIGRTNLSKFEDLKQEASIGVLKSLAKWSTEKSKDGKFISYMMLWVNGLVYNYLSYHAGDVRIPKKNIEKVLRDLKNDGEVAEGNRKYTTSYIYLNKPRENIEEVDSILYNEYRMFSENDVIKRNRIRDTEKLATLAIDSLKDSRLKYIVKNRSEDATLEEIGKHLGMSGERVRQLETRALHTLRNNKGLMSIIKDWVY